MLLLINCQFIFMVYATFGADREKLSFQTFFFYIKKGNLIDTIKRRSILNSGNIDDHWWYYSEDWWGNSSCIVFNLLNFYNYNIFITISIVMIY